MRVQEIRVNLALDLFTRNVVGMRWYDSTRRDAGAAYSYIARIVK